MEAKAPGRARLWCGTAREHTTPNLRLVPDKLRRPPFSIIRRRETSQRSRLSHETAICSMGFPVVPNVSTARAPSAGFQRAMEEIEPMPRVAT